MCTMNNHANRKREVRNQLRKLTADVLKSTAPFTPSSERSPTHATKRHSTHTPNSDHQNVLERNPFIPLVMY